MMIGKDDYLLKKRLTELAETCYRRDVPSYTDFLTLSEQTIFHSMKRELAPVRHILTGGYEAAERKMVCFLSSYEDETAVLPISIIKAEPANLRFAPELTHRDYLGALMNLGIERGLIGDILMREKGCFIFCLERMAEFIMAELTKVGHTQIKCELVTEPELSLSPKEEEISGSIASARLDNLIALAFKISRSKTVGYIEGEKAFINGRMTSSSGAQLKGGEIVSVRGLGKFLYVGIEKGTKKGRLYVKIRKYC